MEKNNQHEDFPSSHLPEYYPRVSQVDFIERTGYGSLWLLWPIIPLYSFCSTIHTLLTTTKRSFPCFQSEIPSIFPFYITIYIYYQATYYISHTTTLFFLLLHNSNHMHIYIAQYISLSYWYKQSIIPRQLEREVTTFNIYILINNTKLQWAQSHLVFTISSRVCWIENTCQIIYMYIVA